MKCEICKKKLQMNFLEKPIGTYVKDQKGKKHIICDGCQQQFKSKKEMLDKI